MTKSPAGETLKACPVCKKKYLPEGLKNHIINSAKSEVWNKLEKKPHNDFYWKHCKIVKIDKKLKPTLSFLRIKR